jgi:hypothetical protein
MRRSDINIDRAALAAVGAIGVAWFLMTTLVVNFGPWRQNIHFYDVWAVIQDPGGRLSGVNGAHAFATIGFGILCAAAVVAPAVSIIYKRRDAGWMYLLPFLLMTVSGVTLYAKTSSSHFPSDSDSHSLSAFMAHIAQSAVNRASDTVASHVSIGAGAYLAMLCSCFLALRGLRAWRAPKRAGAVANGTEDLAPRRHEDARARQIEP